MAARARRERVRALLAKYGYKTRGVQARIARELGVSEATISRDAQSIGLVKWAMENPAKALKLLYG
jgi:arginine repressor